MEENSTPMNLEREKMCMLQCRKRNGFAAVRQGVDFVSLHQRNHIVAFRLNDEEYRILQEKASGNLSAYCRRRILLEEDSVCAARENRIKALTYQIRKIGVNINQIAARINSGIRWESDIGQLYRQLCQVEDLLQQIQKEKDSTCM